VEHSPPPRNHGHPPPPVVHPTKAQATCLACTANCNHLRWAVEALRDWWIDEAQKAGLTPRQVNSQIHIGHSRCTRPTW